MEAAGGGGDVQMRESMESSPPPPTEQKIAIACDGSEYSDYCIRFEEEQASLRRVKTAPNFSLGMKNVKTAPNFKTLHMSPGVLASMWKEEEQKTKDLEEKMRVMLKDRGISGSLRTTTGKPGEMICKIAEEEKADMIVVGTRGMGKIRRTILGSVSDFLVNHAHCPVVVCRKPSDVSGRFRFTSGDSIRQKFRRLSGSDKRSKSVSAESDVQ